MAEKGNAQIHLRPLRRMLLGLLILFLLASFVFWRIDGPRAERFRAHVIDKVIPNFDWAMRPVTSLGNMLADFQSYQRVYEQNQELRRELQRMRAWKEAALQLEQVNARLMALNNVELDPSLTFITGVVIADSGSPFRRTVLLNLGATDGMQDGWATMDGIGFAGRISGVGERTSRVLLATDSSSRVPVRILPTGQTALMVGDNSNAPILELIENPDRIRPGDRVVTSGDDGVLPPDLLVGTVAQGNDSRLRVLLSADHTRLEFLRVLRSRNIENVDTHGTIVRPSNLGVTHD